MPEQIGNAGNIAMAWAKRIPAENISPAANVNRKEIKARNSVPVATEDSDKKGVKSSPRINPVEIADKVYRLMRSDLILERERTTKMGG